MTEPTGNAAAPVEASPPIVHWEAPEPQVGPAPGVEFAPHGSRFVAYILDTVIIYAVMIPLFVVALLLSGLDQQTSTGTGSMAQIAALFPVVIVGFVILFGYFPFFWARSGQTPGMRPFALWVVRDRDGTKLSAGTALLRLIGLYVASSVFYLGLIWIFIDKRHRGWHDLIAGTVVVHRTQGRSST